MQINKEYLITCLSTEVFSVAQAVNVVLHVGGDGNRNPGACWPACLAESGTPGSVRPYPPKNEQQRKTCNASLADSRVCMCGRTVLSHSSLFLV